MDTLIMDLVMFVQAVENDAFEPFIEDLKKDKLLIIRLNRKELSVKKTVKNQFGTFFS